MCSLMAFVDLVTYFDIPCFSFAGEIEGVIGHRT